MPTAMRPVSVASEGMTVLIMVAFFALAIGLVQALGRIIDCDASPETDEDLDRTTNIVG